MKQKTEKVGVSGKFTASPFSIYQIWHHFNSAGI